MILNAFIIVNGICFILHFHVWLFYFLSSNYLNKKTNCTHFKHKQRYNQAKLYLNNNFFVNKHFRFQFLYF